MGARLGFLVAAQLASEGPRIRYTSQERSPLVETALRLQAEQEAVRIDPKQAEFRYNLALAWHEAGSLRNAVKEFEEAVL